MTRQILLTFGFAVLLTAALIKIKSSHRVSAARILALPVVGQVSSSDDLQVVNEFRDNAQRTGTIYRLSKLPKSLTLKWQAPQGNLGFHTASKATPAADSSGLYLGLDTGWFKKFDFSGRELWSFYVETPARGIHSTAALSAETVFFGAYNGWFYALDKSTGRLRWMSALGTAIGSSPLLYDRSILIAVETKKNGYLARLDARDGHQIWTSEDLGDQSHSSPTLDEKLQRLFVGTNFKEIVAINLNDGKLIWRTKVQAEVKSTGALWKQNLIYTSVDGTVICLDAVSGKLVWQTKASGRLVGHVAIDTSAGRGYLAVKGGLMALDLSTGRNFWRSKRKVLSAFDSEVDRQTPVLLKIDSSVFVVAQCDLNTLCLLRSETGKIVNRFALNGLYSNSPILRDHELLISYDHGGLVDFAF